LVQFCTPTSTKSCDFALNIKIRYLHEEQYVLYQKVPKVLGPEHIATSNIPVSQCPPILDMHDQLWIFSISIYLCFLLTIVPTTSALALHIQMPRKLLETPSSQCLSASKSSVVDYKTRQYGVAANRVSKSRTKRLVILG
jgi:hypothetical protein